MTGSGRSHLTAAAVAAAGLLTLPPGPDGPGGIPSAPSSAAVAARADTVVDGFHGYRFGTPAARIGEIDGSRAPDARHEGLEVYARTLRFIGMPTRAYFYLDTAEHRLRRGKHLIEPDPAACVRELTTLRLMLAGTYPDLRVDVIRGSGAAADTATAGGGPPPVQCPGFVEAEEARGWSVLFRNPETDATEIRIELFRHRGEPRILACYLNESDCVWPDSASVEPGPKLLAPSRAPDTTGKRPRGIRR